MFCTSHSHLAISCTSHSHRAMLKPNQYNIQNRSWTMTPQCRLSTWIPSPPCKYVVANVDRLSELSCLPRSRKSKRAKRSTKQTATAVQTSFCSSCHSVSLTNRLPSTDIGEVLPWVCTDNVPLAAASVYTTQFNYVHQPSFIRSHLCGTRRGLAKKQFWDTNSLGKMQFIQLKRAPYI